MIDRIRAFLRGDYFWPGRLWERPLAWVICRLFGHTENVKRGGDCHRCFYGTTYVSVGGDDA